MWCRFFLSVCLSLSFSVSLCLSFSTSLSLSISFVLSPLLFSLFSSLIFLYFSLLIFSLWRVCFSWKYLKSSVCCLSIQFCYEYSFLFDLLVAHKKCLVKSFVTYFSCFSLRHWHNGVCTLGRRTLCSGIFKLFFL